MNTSFRLLLLLCAGTLASCGGSSSDPAANLQPTGTINLALTDGPMDEAQELVLHVTHIDLGHADGSVTRMELMGGPQDIDIMQFQNGMTHDLLDMAVVPAGQYHWMELGVDLQLSHIGTMSGGMHGMTLADADAMRALHDFQVGDGQHVDFVMDFDLHSAVQQHDMGGMMGVEYQLHNGMSLMDMANTGGIMGTVDTSMVDINHAACDPAAGGNWVYLFDGAVSQPDDQAVTDTDGFPGPIAADLVEMDVATGIYHYHFGFVPAGNYRVAFTCSGEWDEEGDDDYPTDPDARFDFQGFSSAFDVMVGQMMTMDITP